MKQLPHLNENSLYSSSLICLVTTQDFTTLVFLSDLHPNPNFSYVWFREKRRGRVEETDRVGWVIYVWAGLEL